jgi:hypothetical protein
MAKPREKPMSFVYNTIDVVIICGAVITCSIIRNITKFYIEKSRKFITKTENIIPLNTQQPTRRDPASETRVRTIPGGR